MVKLRIERKNRIATLYFIQGICIEKRGKIWIADVLLKEVRLRDNTKSVLNSIKNLFESMSPLIEAIGSFLERLYTNIILPMLTWLIENGLPTLLNVLASVFDFLGEHQWIIDAKGIFNSIKQICSGFITFLKGAFTGNIDMALKGVLGILRGVANLVFSIFKTPVNEVIALFNAMGQTIVKAINNLIDGLNHIKVPDWVPGIGGKGINLSHANFRRVPYLAQGAVIPAGNPFLAVLGDQTKGNNLEMPENLLRKIVSEESGKGTGMIKLVVNLDSRTVLEQLINTAKEMQMSNGQNVFELGR